MLIVEDFFVAKFDLYFHKKNVYNRSIERRNSIFKDERLPRDKFTAMIRAGESLKRFSINQYLEINRGIFFNHENRSYRDEKKPG